MNRESCVPSANRSSVATEICRCPFACGGPTWAAHDDTSVVSAIAGVTIAADDPESMRERWTEAGIDTSVRFVPAGERGEGLDAVDLVAADRRRVGERFDVGGVSWLLV